MRVSGPVSTGAKGWAFGIPTVDFASLGYRQDEYFLEGEASRYGPRPGTELGWDGHWQVVPIEAASIVTRIVVVRPIDPTAFNGTVIVLWNNVTAGYENFTAGDSPALYEAGYAYVAVSAQRVGVHGTSDNPQGLRTWNPERYGRLSIPSDDYSFDIFTQAATSVGPSRAEDGVDPMEGLDVRQLIAQGASQSAARLATYINAIQPIAKVFDAFYLQLYFGGGTPLDVGDELMTVSGAAADSAQPQIPEGLHLLRDDLGVPVMVVNSECEAMSCLAVRQSDSDNYRYWEVAGASHVSLQGIESSAPRMERDFGFSIPIDEAMRNINQVSVAPVIDAALQHLQAWVCEGTPPPVQPLIEFDGSPPEIVRDSNGIARGGIRLPQVEVPLACNSATPRAPDIFARLVGSYEAFPPERLRLLYGSRDHYIALFEKATRSAEAASAIRPRDGDLLLTEANASVPF